MRKSQPFQQLRNGQWPEGFYHWNDGWYFGRNTKGDVHVIKENMNIDLLIPAAQWVSIIVALSHDSSQDSAATALHGIPKKLPRKRKQKEVP